MVLVLVLGGVMVYAAVNTTLSVQVQHCNAVPASELPGEFARWRTALEQHAVQGTVFDEEISGSAEDYSFYVYTVNVYNNGLIDADMLELQVAPADGDVLSYSEAASLGQSVNKPVMVPTRGTAQLKCILLTRAGNHAVRTLYVTYYIWGHPFTVKLTYG